MRSIFVNRQHLQKYFNNENFPNYASIISYMQCCSKQATTVYDLYDALRTAMTICLFTNDCQKE